jgi:hypothetical protein
VFGGVTAVEGFIAELTLLFDLIEEESDEL